MRIRLGDSQVHCKIMVEQNANYHSYHKQIMLFYVLNQRVNWVEWYKTMLKANSTTNKTFVL